MPGDHVMHLTTLALTHILQWGSATASLACRKALLLLMLPPALLNHDLTMMLVVHALRVQATRTDIMIQDLVFDNDGRDTAHGYHA